MTERAKILLLLMLIALGVGVIYLRTLTHRVLVEVPQRGEETARAKLNQIALQSADGTTQMATLYFPLLSEDKIVAESRSLTWAQVDADRVRQVVLALAEGSHEGYGRVLPASTTVRAVFLASDGTAYVDLANDALNDFEPGIETETLAIYCVVNSISTNIPAVKHVHFLVQGQEVETLDGHVDLTAAFAPDLTRVKSNP